MRFTRKQIYSGVRRGRAVKARADGTSDSRVREKVAVLRQTRYVGKPIPVMCTIVLMWGHVTYKKYKTTNESVYDYVYSG